MDLQLYFRVIWRFRILVFVGLVLAILLAFFSFFRLSFSGATPKVDYRQVQTWGSTETLLITTSSGAYFRTGSGATSGLLGGVAMNYAEIASGDAVQAIMKKDGPIGGTMTTDFVVDSITNRNPLPYVRISGYATSPRRAISIAERGSKAFRQYVAQQQDSQGVPVGQRLDLQVLSAAVQAHVVQARRKTVPIVIFLTMLIATLGLVFILENLRPRVAPVRLREDEEDQRQRRIGRGA